MHSTRKWQRALVIVISGTAFLGRPERASAQCEGTWTLRTPVTSPSARALSGMVYDSARHVMVLFGGRDNNSNSGVDDTWEFDGTNWSQKFPATAPSARLGQYMAYDSNRHVTVLFGGAFGNIENDETWEWDGTNWTRRTFAISPGRRALGAMTFDSSRGVVVLYGGIFLTGSSNSISDAELLGDTWEYDGTNWTEVFPLSSPPPLAEPSLTYDSLRNVTVLFGGLDLSEPSDETWEWNGTNWTERTPPLSPPARDAHAAAFDEAHGVTVIFGGVDATNTDLNDTWEWNGASWQQRTPVSPPSPRRESAMAFDVFRGVSVLFGGGSNETWERLTGGPTILQQPADIRLTAGQPASFSVIAGGTGGAPSFAWRKNGSPLADGGAVSGSHTAALSINPTSISDAGSYDVIVTNICGSITSRGANLDPCAGSGSNDCNNNGILDSCEIAAAASLDANNNGTIDSCETEPGQLPGRPSAPGVESAPCGTCGGGAAAMMPLTLSALIGVRRKRSHRHNQVPRCRSREP